jgi:hypothetical protein
LLKDRPTACFLIPEKSLNGKRRMAKQLYFTTP